MNFEKVNDLLEDFYKLFYETEDLALKQGIKGLTTTELHVIEAIGTDSLTMNELSEKLGITMGTATVAINKLSEKCFIERKRCSHDRRKVFVNLAKKGIEALKYHTDFHKNIISNITKTLSKNELTSFVSVFSKILTNLENEVEFIRPNMISSFPIASTLSIIDVKGTPAIKSFFLEKNLIKGSLLKLISKDSDSINIEIENKKFEININDAKNLIAIKKDI